jgi:hypothetical protein
MKGLGVKFSGEMLDCCRINPQTPRAKGLAYRQIFQKSVRSFHFQSQNSNLSPAVLYRGAVGKER